MTEIMSAFYLYRPSVRDEQAGHAALDNDVTLRPRSGGNRQRFPEDEENLAQQFDIYDALYAWCRLQVTRQ